MAEQIKILLIKKGMTITDLAKLINTSTQNLSNKLKRNDFKMSELRDIAEALDVVFETYFLMEDGTKI
ncbi:helix-turn-helix domain-containing protein [Psychrobacillus sp. Sa2BUA9]|uniref:Helix-turn-helix domain-containing protein n=1 Tax=Psychrobacillus faecigallinarum TaxID=2762235 RepID=A0ABR8REW4_9BACI|nr:helix-turn-helix domain-containing protein [Psychrobacillus faecigallinarum]MBD7946354.1 helix-turn-helix domain-containing protein [Psychrobacillus faecigallinarum]